jgi:hypothetical protein
MTQGNRLNLLEDSKKVFLKCQKIPSLVTLSKQAVAGQWYERNQSLLVQEIQRLSIDQLPIITPMKDEILSCKKCYQCCNLCFDNSIQVLEMRLRPCSSKKLLCCSLECAREDKDFKESRLFHYSTCIWK